MDKKRLFLRILILMMLLLTGCGYAAPEKAVHQEMELIRKLDEDTIRSFVSYEDIRQSQSEPAKIGEETIDAVRLFFKNFKYRIRSSSVSEDRSFAVVNLNITNLDAKQLARDLCRSMIMESTAKEERGRQEGLASSFALMKKCLEENNYPLVTTEASVHLTNQDGVWVIQESAELEDALAGGLVTYLQDPYLLSPQEVLECTLSPFTGFSAEDWADYLDFNDVFNVGGEIAPELDRVLSEQIAAFFRYEISDVSQDGDNASADVAVSSLDLQGVLDKCRQKLLDYALTTESIRATDAQISQKAAEYLLQALKDNKDSSETDIQVSLFNNGHSWEAMLDETFADALLGGADTAVETLYPDSD